MNISFNPVLMKITRNLLVIILVAKVLSLLMLWYFPSEGVNYHPSSSKMPEYRRYSVQNIIKPVQRADIKSSVEENELTSYGPNISNMVILGLYKTKSGGLIVIALKASRMMPTSSASGRRFKAIHLKTSSITGLSLTKTAVAYSLLFSEEEPKERSAKKSATASGDEGIKQVEKSDINYYAKNFDQIWQDIGIEEVKKDGKITGFKVTRIKTGTPFATLGLRQGDIIIKANNKPMTSYKDALEIYKNIDKLEALQLIVLRNNQETEIVYEIN